MLVSSDGYCTVVLFDENMPLHHTQQRDLQLKSVALAHSHSLISNPGSGLHGSHGHSTSHTTPAPANTHTQQHATTLVHGSNASTAIPNSPLVHPPPSPFVPPHAPSPAVSTKDLPGPPSLPTATTSGSGTGMKRTASTFDPPTPAPSVGGDGDAAMQGGNASESERERMEEGRAKKRRRVELKHHGAGDT